MQSGRSAPLHKLVAFRPGSPAASTRGVTAPLPIARAGLRAAQIGTPRDAPEPEAASGELQNLPPESPVQRNAISAPLATIYDVLSPSGSGQNEAGEDEVQRSNAAGAEVTAFQDAGPSSVDETLAHILSDVAADSADQHASGGPRSGAAPSSQIECAFATLQLPSRRVNPHGACASLQVANVPRVRAGSSRASLPG
jgi:hypothetical protein